MAPIRFLTPSTDRYASTDCSPCHHVSIYASVRHYNFPVQTPHYSTKFKLLPISTKSSANMSVSPLALPSNRHMSTTFLLAPPPQRPKKLIASAPNSTKLSSWSPTCLSWVSSDLTAPKCPLPLLPATVSQTLPLCNFNLLSAPFAPARTSLQFLPSLSFSSFLFRNRRSQPNLSLPLLPRNFRLPRMPPTPLSPPPLPSILLLPLSSQVVPSIGPDRPYRSRRPLHHRPQLPLTPPLASCFPNPLGRRLSSRPASVATSPTPQPLPSLRSAVHWTSWTPNRLSTPSSPSSTGHHYPPATCSPLSLPRIPPPSPFRNSLPPVASLSSRPSSVSIILAVMTLLQPTTYK
jgi:hypothetical protein